MRYSENTDGLRDKATDYCNIETDVYRKFK